MKHINMKIIIKLLLKLTDDELKATIKEAWNILDKREMNRLKEKRNESI